MMGKAYGNIKALILESCVISQVFVTLCNLYNFQALRCSYIFYQHNGCAVVALLLWSLQQVEMLSTAAATAEIMMFHYNHYGALF